MLSKQALSVCVFGAGVISLLLQIVGLSTSGWIVVSFTTKSGAINSSSSTDELTTNGLVNTELPGVTGGSGTPPIGAFSNRPVDNDIPSFGANRNLTATRGRIPHKKPVDDGGIRTPGPNDRQRLRTRINPGQSNAPIDNGGLPTPRPEDNQSPRRTTRADHSNVSTPSPPHEPTDAPVSTTRGNFITKPVFRPGRRTGPIDE